MGRRATIALGIVAFLIGASLLVDRLVRDARERRARGPFDDQFVRILLESRPRDRDEDHRRNEDDGRSRAEVEADPT